MEAYGHIICRLWALSFEFFIQVVSVDLKEIMLVKALLTARDILLEELLKLSRAVEETIDLTDFISKMDDIRLFNSVLQANMGAGKAQNDFEVLNFIGQSLLHFIYQFSLVFFPFVVLTKWFLLSFKESKWYCRSSE